MQKSGATMYKNIKTGREISDEDALAYAMQQCGIAQFDEDAPDASEFAAMLVDWYYSGDWRRTT